MSWAESVRALLRKGEEALEDGLADGVRSGGGACGRKPGTMYDLCITLSPRKLSTAFLAYAWAPSREQNQRYKQQLRTRNCIATKSRNLDPSQPPQHIALPAAETVGTFLLIVLNDA